MRRLTIEKVDALPSVSAGSAADVQVWRDSEGAVCAYGCTVSGKRWMHFPTLASFRMDDHGGATALVAPPVSLEVVLDTYYRAVFPILLQASGREVLHASAVATRRGVIGLCAASGSGKSTIAYGLHRRGLRLWADDALAFEVEDEAVRALPLPFRLRLRPSAAAHFGVSPGSEAEFERWESALREEPRPSPLVALVMLTRGLDGETIRPPRRLSPVAAFTRVLAHARSFSPSDSDRTRRMVRHYLRLVAEVPVLEIRFPSGLERLATVLDHIQRAIDVC